MITLTMRSDFVITKFRCAYWLPRFEFVVLNSPEFSTALKVLGICEIRPNRGCCIILKHTKDPTSISANVMVGTDPRERADISGCAKHGRTLVTRGEQ